MKDTDAWQAEEERAGERAEKRAETGTGHPCRKIYVEVEVTHRADGSARPNRLCFEDRVPYEIDRVIHICRAASTRVGGSGIRYTVQICGQQAYLYDEENGRWFVEGK